MMAVFELVVLAAAVFAAITLLSFAVLVAVEAAQAARQRGRVAREVQLAEWQLRQLSRAAMWQMLVEARRSQGGPER
jgi:ABC-type phosphate transport system permease subunit